MGPRGEQDRVYEEKDQPCDLCKSNGWKPADKGKGKGKEREKDKDSSSDPKDGGSDRKDKDPDQRPAKRKRVDD